MGLNRIVVGNTLVVLDGTTGNLQVTKNGNGVTTSGHGLSINKCRDIREVLTILSRELANNSNPALDEPRIHLGLRLGVLALAEGLVTEKAELPGLRRVLGLFGKSNWYDCYITVNRVVYPLTIHETNLVDGKHEMNVAW